MKKTLSLATMLLLGMLCSNSLQADCCCSPNIVDIRHVPFHIDGTINPSNTTYCITNNLTYIPEVGDPAAAITIDPGVHDIIIEFNGFELDLAPSVNGISMLGTASARIIGVVIKDGVIKSITPSAVNQGVIATNFTDVLVEHMRFVDTRRGFYANSQIDANFDLKFSSCLFDLKGATGVSRRCIQLNSIQGLQVEDCSFLAVSPETTSSAAILFLNNSQNALIQRCTFDGHLAGIVAQSVFNAEGFTFTFPSANIQVDECEFTNNRFVDIELVGTSNVHVTNSSFYGAGFVSLAFGLDPDGALDVSPIPSGLLVDSCTFTTTGTDQPVPNGTFEPVVLFAGSRFQSGTCARDIIISNSTFTHQGAVPLSDDLLFSGVEGAIIENCVFDFTGTGRESGCEHTSILGFPQKAANIHLGGILLNDGLDTVVGGNGVKDVIIRGNEICGGAQVGIYAETSVGTIPNERITIEDNSITATEEGILFENTHSSTIIGNRVQGVNGNTCKKGVGIKLAGALSYNSAAASNSNAILNNIVSNNTKGISLKCGAQGNLVKGNSVFNNDKHQIKEQKKKTNVIVDNTVFNHNNQKLDCKSCSSSS